jgi:hypothetical protein
MIDELPMRALMRLELPIRYKAKAPLLTGDTSRWSDDHLVPPLCEIDGQAAESRVWWAWNEDHLFVAFNVKCGNRRPMCDTTHWWKKDGLRLCIDTRDARDIRRATRWCRFFYFLPTGGGSKRNQPVAGTHRMSRAKEPAPAIDVSKIRMGVRIHAYRYELEAAIPAACLIGWDPVEHPRIGIFYKIKSIAAASQNLTVTDDLGWNVDPSTWATGVLTK